MRRDARLQQPLVATLERMQFGVHLFELRHQLGVARAEACRQTVEAEIIVTRGSRRARESEWMGRTAGKPHLRISLRKRPRRTSNSTARLMSLSPILHMRWARGAIGSASIGAVLAGSRTGWHRPTVRTAPAPAGLRAWPGVLPHGGGKIGGRHRAAQRGFGAPRGGDGRTLQRVGHRRALSRDVHRRAAGQGLEATWRKALKQDKRRAAASKTGVRCFAPVTRRQSDAQVL